MTVRAFGWPSPSTAERVITCGSGTRAAIASSSHAVNSCPGVAGRSSRSSVPIGSLSTGKARRRSRHVDDGVVGMEPSQSGIPCPGLLVRFRGYLTQLPYDLRALRIHFPIPRLLPDVRGG